MAFNVSASSVTSNVTFTNAISITDPFTPIWSVTPIFLLVICITGSVTNIGALTLFVKRLQTGLPFDVYVINLIGSNVASLLMQYPLAVKAGLHPSAWTLGRPLCHFYLYCQSIFDAGISNTHAIIAINRAWAILHPLSFRAAHTKRFTTTVSALMWVYIHVVEGSYWLVQTVYYPVNVQMLGCGYNQSLEWLKTWTRMTTIIIYLTPVVIVVISFLIVMISRMLRFRAIRERSTGSWKPRNPAVRAVRQEPQPVVLSSKRERYDMEPSAPGAARPTEVAMVLPQQRKSRSSRYVMLMLLTISVVVFLIPDTVYYLLGGSLPEVWVVANLLFACQTVVDPIIFVLTMDKLRTVMPSRQQHL
ncbi:hypothetical protein BV898_02117 [Hypsibius exemplaris]|uniref:G-protein coupled receptors family 1 profile domain-containing protein n=1 Tax=Hypsibius exemplaris TaxID=2072580 RepID=A0A1W0X9F7_HYPEX|nr:hypothetical protein BV898_02117 [Hypsibius exemplaris]